MPGSSTCISVLISVNGGAGLWMGLRMLASMGPASSTGSPTTFMIRPRTSRPTGTEIISPVFSTGMPRTSPSVESMAMHRTVFSPRCWATSTTRFHSRSSMLGLVILRAV